MPAFRLSCFILACVLQPVSLADTSVIDPSSERLYQQAAPYLQDADKNLQAVELRSPNPEIQARNRALGVKASEQLKTAIPLLEQAAALEHPVAQYRLALIYLTYLPEVSKEKACTLLKKSLSHGFSPPAVPIESFCYTYTDTPEYRSILQNMQPPTPTYESYFPQPAMNLACRREEAPGAGFQWADGRDYQAEIYWLLGAHDRANRSEYAKKAVDINNCYRAQRWLGKPKQSEK
jgi:TPR repeat protein